MKAVFSTLLLVTNRVMHTLDLDNFREVIARKAVVVLYPQYEENTLLLLLVDDCVALSG